MNMESPQTISFLDNVEAEAGALAPGQIVRAAADHWPLILALALLGSALGFLKGWQTPPSYSTTATLQVERRSAMDFGLPSSILTLQNRNPNASDEARILTSRRVVAAAVDEPYFTTRVHPVRLPVIGAALSHAGVRGTSLLLKPLGWIMDLEPYAWAGDRIDVPNLHVDGGAGTVIVQVDDALRYTLLGEAGQPVANGTVEKVTEFTTRDGKQAKLVIQAIRARPGTRFQVVARDPRQVVEEAQRAVTVLEGERNSGIIDVRVRGTDPEWTARLANSLSEEYVRQGLERTYQDTAQMLEYIGENLPGLEARLIQAERELGDFMLRVGAVDLNSDVMARMEALEELQRRVAELELEEIQLGKSLTENHPSIESLRAARGRLEAQQREIEGRLREIPGKQGEYLQLKREATIANQLYTAFLTRAQELRVAKSGTVGNLRIIDKAIEPRAPVRTARTQMVYAGTLIGILLGLAFAVARRWMLHTIEDADEIEDELGIPSLATVPQADKGDTDRSTLLACSAAESLAIEGLESLRTTLMLNPGGGNGLCVLGPSPSVGKSFVASNLAALFADLGQSVCLVDTDIRRGRLADLVGSDDVPGLTEILTKGVALDEVLTTIPGTSVQLLARGTELRRPLEQLQSEQFRKLVSELQARFDRVIFDTAPILAVSDALAVAEMVGDSILILRADQSRLSEAQRSQRILNRNKLSLRGLVLNGVRRKLLSRTGYGGYYGDYATQYTQGDGGRWWERLLQRLRPGR